MTFIKNNTVTDNAVAIFGTRTREAGLFRSVVLDEQAIKELVAEGERLRGIRYDWMVWFRPMTTEEEEIFAPMISAGHLPPRKDLHPLKLNTNTHSCYKREADKFATEQQFPDSITSGSTPPEHP